MASFRGGQLHRLVRGVSAASLAVYVVRDRHRHCFSGLALPRSHCAGRTSPVCCEAGSSPAWADFKAEYRGQLTPLRKPAAVGQVPSTPVLLQGGPFKSRWLRVYDEARVDDVMEALTQAEEGAKTAVYVGVPDDHTLCGGIVAALRTRGFRFHHFHEEGPGSPAGELIYYRWAGAGQDMVPSYATALEGIGVIVLSPERDAVLLAWEYGNWKMVTGNVDAGESMVETVRREVREEVGLEVEEEMILLGGWQAARSRDKSVNNIFCVFAATAKSREAKVDGVEVTDARWFPLASLPTLQELSQAAKVPNKPFSMDWDLGVPERNYLSLAIPRFLNVQHQGRGLKVRSHLGRDWFQ